MVDWCEPYSIVGLLLLLLMLLLLQLLLDLFILLLLLLWLLLTLLCVPDPWRLVLYLLPGQPRTPCTDPFPQPGHGPDPDTGWPKLTDCTPCTPDWWAFPNPLDLERDPTPIVGSIDSAQGDTFPDPLCLLLVYCYLDYWLVVCFQFIDLDYCSYWWLLKLLLTPLLFCCTLGLEPSTYWRVDLIIIIIVLLIEFETHPPNCCIIDGRTTWPQTLTHYCDQTSQLLLLIDYSQWTDFTSVFDY